MRIDRFFKIAKRSAGYFGTSAFAVNVIFAVLAAASFVVAPHIALPVAAGVGLIFALVAARNAKRDIANQEYVARRQMQSIREVHEIKGGVDVLMSRYRSKRSYSEDSGKSARASASAIYAAMNVNPAKVTYTTLDDLPKNDPDFEFKQPIVYQRSKSFDLADGESSIETPKSIETPESLDTPELLAVANAAAFTAEERARLSRKTSG